MRRWCVLATVTDYVRTCSATSTATSEASGSRTVGMCAPQRNQEAHMYISIGAAILIVLLLIIFVF